MRHGYLKYIVKGFETDPVVQKRIHLFFTYFWLLWLVLTPIIVRPTTKDQWVALIILEVSLYANFATDFGGVSAAEAAETCHCGLTAEQRDIASRLKA